MQAGTLKDIIEIQKAVETANPDNGEQRMTWQQVWRGRAKIDFSSGSQTIVNGETINRITKKVTIRTKPAFNERLSMLRVIINGDSYRILAKDVRGRDMATIFTCELINE